MIAIRNKLLPDTRFVDYLQQVAQTITSALEHQDYPLVSIIKDTQVPRLPKKHPLFPVMLVLEEDPANYWQFSNCDVQPLPCDNGTSKFEMLLALMTTQRGFVQVGNIVPICSRNSYSTTQSAMDQSIAGDCLSTN